jgi:hypothetical protein
MNFQANEYRFTHYTITINQPDAYLATERSGSDSQIWTSLYSFRGRVII